MALEKNYYHSQLVVIWHGIPSGGGAYISIRVVESNRINIFSYGSATALDGILRVYPVKIY